jgi:hypothetical protein
MDMGRCIYCHSVVTRQEDSCYLCGDNVPRRAKAAVQSSQASALTNLAFLASLVFMAYCFFGEHQLSLPVTLLISSLLLLIGISAEWLANKN